MCNINFNKKSKCKSGYKVLAQEIESGKLYSSFTGQPFNTGAVPKPPAYCRRLSNWNFLLDSHSLISAAFYNKEYAGFSSAFRNKSNAQSLMNTLGSASENYTLVIAKITFSGDTFSGYYGNLDSHVIAGNNIESIKVL
jgi:hypothetical protein